ncbi:MAG TPA: DUF5335 family protein [Pyrinomonadaceae bacterium]
MREIPRDEWVAFLDSFSRQHEGWLVTVEVLGTEIGAQVEAEEMRLEGITADLKDGEDVVSVILNKGATERITHNVTQPTHIRVEQTESGANMALQIESGDGVTTLVRFRSAMLPEMVDGIVTE